MFFISEFDPYKLFYRCVKLTKYCFSEFLNYMECNLNLYDEFGC